MTKSYALRKLLEHGPMTRGQLIECTRWTANQVRWALSECIAKREVRRVGRARIGDSKATDLYLAIKS